MMSNKFISFLLSMLLVTNALGDNLASSWIEQKISTIEQKIQELETAVRFTGCQRYVAHGYRYEHMYPIDGVYFDNVKLEKNNGDLSTFEMNIAIKSEKDGIILLSSTANPGPNDLVFEIGVGIAVNKFTVLRITKNSSNEVARVSTPQILSKSQYTKLYINISDDLITVGKEGEEPIISYSDIRLRKVKYFGMSSWGVIDGKFLYDCPSATPIY